MMQCQITRRADERPARFHETEEARRRFSEKLDRLAPYLLRSDPLADAVVAAFAALDPGAGFQMLERALSAGIGAVPDAPPALVALFEQLDRVPFWVDWRAIDRAGEAFIRTGAAGGIVLGLESLVLGYASPGGNKPLVFSGRLREQALRRLAETSRFVHAVNKQGGLRRFGDGFAITVKVRIMHAQVRRLLWNSGRWRADLWGEPINQHDMVATILLFSAAMLDGLSKLGFHIPAEDAEDIIHLWRYVGHLIGVDAELLPTTAVEARETAEMIKATQGLPDDDARALVRALLEARIGAAKTDAQRQAEVRRAMVVNGICRSLLGDELADHLAVQKNGWRYVVPAIRPVLSALARAQRLPICRELAFAVGNRYWEVVTAEGLLGTPATFAPPTRFASATA